jgi:hypothetical protein
MNIHATYGLDQRIVLVTERDWLAMEWELHHVRYLLGAIPQHGLYVSSPPHEILAEDDPRAAWGYDRQSMIAFNEKRLRHWNQVMDYLDDLCHENDAEHQWLKENKMTASINELRHSVRTMMTKAGGAMTPDLPEETLKAPAKEEKTMLRSLRWLMVIRNTIAIRRLMTAQAYAILAEGVERGDKEMVQKEFEDGGPFNLRNRHLVDFMENGRFGDMPMPQLVLHREKAAQAIGIAGDYAVPGFLDLDAIGAGDTA